MNKKPSDQRGNYAFSCSPFTIHVCHLLLTFHMKQVALYKCDTDDGDNGDILLSRRASVQTLFHITRTDIGDRFDVALCRCIQVIFTARLTDTLS